MTIPLDEQLAFIERKKERLYVRAQRFMRDNKAEIIAMMADGIREGDPVYGDESWHKTHAELRLEKLKECRDLCNYEGMQAFQGWPK